MRASLSHHLAALAIAEELHDRAMLANIQHVLGVDYHALEDRGQAQHHLSEALRIFKEIGHQAKEKEVKSFMEKFCYLTQEG